MNRVFRHVGAATKGIGSGLRTAATACVSIAASASEPTHNPRHLSAAQISHMEEGYWN